MKIVVLTGSLTGIAAYAVPALAEAGMEITMVIYNEGQILNKKKHYLSKFRKVKKIGLGGAITGIIMRAWFGENAKRYLKPVENLADYCRKNSIPFASSPYINSSTTIDLFKKANADVGLSLSNSFIAPKVFSICPYGMVNVHGEVLPDYQNAQSVIWQLYNGSPFTGFTIHKVERKIDGGAILYKEKFPIIFRNTLADTVSFNCALITEKAVAGLVTFFKGFVEYYNKEEVQEKGSHYTTPSLKQFLKIKSQFSALKNKALTA